MTPLEYLDTRHERHVSELMSFVEIPSVSADPAHGADVIRAAQWVAGQLRQAGPFDVEILETAGHPVVYAEWCRAPGRQTLLIYGHYDVQPADPLDEWRSPPFAPSIRDGRIYARGASDDKGPMVIPIKVAEALFASEGRLPVNVKMLFEGEEEIGSPNLRDFVTRHAERLVANYALSADGAMWRADRPSVTVGSRGIVSLDIDVRGPRSDLHSGRHGGAILNPLQALAEVVAGLHRPDGAVAVPGFYDAVRAASAGERAQMAAVGWDDAEYRREVGVPALFGEPGFTTPERLWTRPTLELNGLGGGYQGPGAKTVIPASAHAKISCRLVPDQQPDQILQLLTSHISTRTPAAVTCTVSPHPGSAPAYRIAPGHPGLTIARRVLREQSGLDPVLVMAGGTLPVSDVFHQVLGIDTVYFSFSTADEAFHAPNEFFRLARFREGLSAWTAFWRSAGDSVPGA